MKSPLVLNIVIAVLLGVIGYVALPVISSTISTEVSMALGLIIGGILTPIIVNLFSKEGSQASTETQTLYVGNLPYRANEDAVREHFSQQGDVVSVRLMKDRRTGKRKGYGFVEMSDRDAKRAIKTLNDTDFQERTLKVRMAKEKAYDE